MAVNKKPTVVCLVHVAEDLGALETGIKVSNELKAMPNHPRRRQRKS